MSLFKVIIWGFVIYCIYKFVFEFVVPVSKAAGDMKDKISQMQKAQEQYIKQQQQQYNQQQTTTKVTTSNEKNNGDYIEFEEIKD